MNQKPKKLNHPSHEPIFNASDKVELVEDNPLVPRYLTVRGSFIGWPVSGDQPKWVYTFVETTVGAQEKFLKKVLTLLT